MGRKFNSGLSLGASGQLSMDNYDLMSVLSSQVVAGYINYMKSNDNFYKYISRSNDLDSNGYKDIIAHGNSKLIEIYVNGKKHNVNWRTLTNMIKHNPELKGKKIRLLSCNTGNTSNDENCFAQNLANKLNTVVLAPTKYLFAEPNSNYFVAGGKYNKRRNCINPDMNDLGEFKIFYPRRKK